MRWLWAEDFVSSFIQGDTTETVFTVAKLQRPTDNGQNLKSEFQHPLPPPVILSGPVFIKVVYSEEITESLYITITQCPKATHTALWKPVINPKLYTEHSGFQQVKIFCTQILKNLFASPN